MTKLSVLSDRSIAELYNSKCNYFRCIQIFLTQPPTLLAYYIMLLACWKRLQVWHCMQSYYILF